MGIQDWSQIQREQKYLLGQRKSLREDSAVHFGHEQTGEHYELIVPEQPRGKGQIYW